MSKFDSDGIRLCDQKDCEFPATHTLVWTEHVYYCLIHAEQALKVAGAMGFPTPGRTFRNLTPDEMMPDEPASPSLLSDDTIPDHLYERDGKWYPRVPDTDPAAKAPSEDKS